MTTLIRSISIGGARDRMGTGEVWRLRDGEPDRLLWQGVVHPEATWTWAPFPEERVVIEPGDRIKTVAIDCSVGVQYEEATK